MNCPKCKGESLTKKNFQEPYTCKKCGGMWIRTDEINKLNDCCQTFESSDIINSEQNDKQAGLCPSGHGIMLRARIDLAESFYLERCTSCGGIWFDKGEWQLISEHELHNNIEEFWSQSWQKKHRIEKSREDYINLNRKFLGDNLLESILKFSEELRGHPEKNRALALLTQEVIK